MDFRQLQYVVVLAETLHFGRAAQRMHIAQSAFSAQIARLEREVGAPLFDRSANRVSVTAAGEVFLAHARSILAGVAEASQEARSVHAARQAQMRIGFFSGSAGELTPLIVAAFRQAMPDVQLSFRELSIIDQIDAVTSEDVDIAFIRSPIVNGRVQADELFAEPRFVGLPADHALVAREHVTINDLMDEAFAVAAPDAPAHWREYWACDDVRGEPGRIAASVTTVPEVLNAIAYQGAVAPFPGSAARFLQYPGVVYRPIVDASYSPIALVTKAGERRPHVDAFRHVAQQLATTSLAIVADAVPMDSAPNDTPRAA